MTDSVLYKFSKELICNPPPSPRPPSPALLGRLGLIQNMATEIVFIFITGEVMTEKSPN